MKKNEALLWFGLAAAAGLGIYLYKKKNPPLTVEEKRKWLQSSEGNFRPEPYNRFSDQEVTDTYEIVQAYLRGQSINPDLKARGLIIGTKYNIFT